MSKPALQVMVQCPTYTQMESVIERWKDPMHGARWWSELRASRLIFEEMIR